MKELSIEEKAKAYDEALEREKGVIEQNPLMEYLKKGIKYIFPELKESEDEKIRKDIIILVKDWWDRVAKNNISIKEQMLAWLEKQGEQKPVDEDDLDFAKRLNELRKVQRERNLDELIEMRWSVLKDVEKLTKEMFTIQAKFFFEVGCEKRDKHKPANKFEPKFHVNEWVVTDKNNVVHIKAIENGKYVLENTMSFTVDYVDKCWRKWTIKDAKDGDILKEDSCIFILQKLNDNNTAAKTYCTLHDDGDFEDGSMLYFDVDSTKPATKEQRDLLFSKMKEAGYVIWRRLSRSL